MKNASDNQSSSKPVLATKVKNSTLRATGVTVKGAQRTIVILGVERGGTSMVAGVIRALGVDLGRSLGHNHEDPRFLSEDLQVLKDYVAERNEAADVWGFKMPKAIKNLEFWDNTLRNPVYVIAYRNPLAIADSWIQREAGKLVGIMKRIQVYQTAVVSFLETTSSPVLLVNYERSVQNREAGADFVDELTSFLALDVPDAKRDQAVAMITGDGGGYVDLPEAYFATQRAEQPATTSRIPTVPSGNHAPEADGWISQSKPGRLCPKLEREGGEAFPRFFRMELDFQPGEKFQLGHDKIIMFYALQGPQREVRRKAIDLKPGLNFFDVETSGKVMDLAFKSNKCPSRYRLDVSVLEAVVENVEDDQQWVGQGEDEGLVGRFKGLKKRINRKLKK
ncbi:hypothetical protein MUY35_09055 [Aliiroseovarius sp. S1339]|uniref:hypothetical protein n=1 Tax=Aliiroseovarius sp. S1339 TaxID=2936990 RepID=UPI0020BEF9D3|nr:hypothetical protein [Aliiroseovarius sp. S1339]MCK8463996.1 hypothetical protein [Aliiroseovarius sp. S1339]